jgi:hypothetical protein
MTWKPKEKELTREEAIEQAKKGLIPFWFGSSPLFAGVRLEEGVSLFPLNPEFLKKSWLIFLLDPTTFSGESVFTYIKEWWRRYNSYGLDILIIIIPPYSFLKGPDPIQKLIEKQPNSIFVVDSDETLRLAFDAREIPKVLLLHQGQRQFDQMGSSWNDQVEVRIQRFLRENDPGLAFPPVFKLIKGELKDVERVEFGFQPKIGKTANFGRSTFVATPSGVRIGKFNNTRPHQYEADQLFITGNWIQDGERIMTSDPQAMIGFQGTGQVSVIAQTHSKTTELSIISVELGGSSVHEAVLGEHLSLDDSGESLVKVSKPQIYHILNRLPERERRVTLRFPNSNIAPISLYGLRFGD